MPTYSTFNPAAKDTHVIIDESGMAVINGDPESPKDSGWRTTAAYKAWGDYSLALSALLGCVRYRDRKFEYRRHPKYEWGSDMSRDHVAAMFILVHFCVEDARPASMMLLRNMIRFTKWRISPGSTFTIDMWCWMKGILNKRWRTLFYMIQIPILAVASRWNAYQLKRGDFTMPDLHQRDFISSRINYNVTEKQDKIRNNLYPYYSLNGLAWQNHINPDSPGKRQLSKMIRGMCGAHNYLVRLLADDMTVTKGQVLMWVEVSGAPFGVLLNEACRRTIQYVGSAIDGNWLYADLLVTIWNEKHPEDQIKERIIR